MGGPVAQQGRAADWSCGTRLRLLTRRSGVQFPSGPLTPLLSIHVACLFGIIEREKLKPV